MEHVVAESRKVIRQLTQRNEDLEEAIGRRDDKIADMRIEIDRLKDGKTEDAPKKKKNKPVSFIKHDKKSGKILIDSIKRKCYVIQYENGTYYYSPHPCAGAWEEKDINKATVVDKKCGENIINNSHDKHMADTQGTEPLNWSG